MTIPDPIEEIIGLLIADATVAAIVDGRVGREVPEADDSVMPRGCVVVTPAGGPGRPGRARYRNTRVDTTCYGATLGDSWRLHIAVREALETARTQGALFAIQTLSDGVNARHPVTQWPTCYASYRVMSATEA